MPDDRGSSIIQVLAAHMGTGGPLQELDSVVEQFDDDNTQSFVALSKGTMVAHYRIVEKIGAGGMGEVYLAEDTALKRHVALKFMPAHTAANADMRARFTREARAVAALNHPNIVTIHEVGEFSGRPFFAMEHVPGETLRGLIKQGKLSTNEAIRLTMQICEGLHEAHEAGVVHRDIKPGNIIIDTKGRARLLDFGLAMVSGEDKLTKTGSTLGTAGYMSPEQVSGKQVDHRSDLFSVGVILYEMLTGRRPFEGDNDAAIVNAITNSTPEPVARFKSGVTGELQQVVEKALSKDPSLRYQHADGMLSDLKRLEMGASRSGAKRLRLWAGAATILVLAGWLAVDRYFMSDEEAGGKWSNSIAVLVFHDFSPERDQSYFCEGMTDAIIGRLSGINDLKVISLTSVLQYATRDRDLRKIGRELGVATILEGSIQQAGGRVRIRAQLIDVEDDAHLWSQHYDRELEDVFAVQDDISRTIVGVMRVQFMGEESTSLAGRGTENIEAYNLYLRARHLWRKRIGADIVKAIEYLEQAIELDPDYVLAHSALADAWSIVAGYDSDYDWAETVPKTKEAALRAIELDDMCVEAHTSLGRAYRIEGNFAGAEEQYLRAIDLNPGYALAHLWYSNLLEKQGRLEERNRELELALELDPLSIVAMENLAGVKKKANQLDEAIRLYQRALEITPDNIQYRLYLAYSLIQNDKVEEGFAQYEKAIAINPRSWDTYASYALRFEEAGQSEEADQVFADAMENYPGEAELYFQYGTFIYDNRKDYPKAIDQFKRGLELDPEDPDLFNNMAYSYLELKKADSALWAVNKALELDPDNDDYWDSKGEISDKLGMPDSALIAYGRALEITPNRARYMIGMARAALLTGRYELADSLYEVDANQDKDYVYRAWGRMRQAETLTARGRFREAIARFHENARVDSMEFSDTLREREERVIWYRYWNLLDIYKYYVRDSAAAIETAKAHRSFAVNSARSKPNPKWRRTTAGGMAYIYARRGDFEKAEQWLDTMKNETDTTGPRGSKPIHFYAGAVALERGDFETAVTHLKINGYANMRGLAYLGAGQVKEAVKQFERAVDHRLTYTTACWQAAVVWCYYGLGMAYEADGQTEKAIEQYEIFLDLWKDADEGLESVEDAKARLARLKS